MSPSQIDRFLDAWFAARQLIQAANFNRFHKAGLSATQFMTLNMLPTGTRATPIGELARHLNLKPATVAQTVNSLEQRGLVTRHRGETDKRLVLLRITTKGTRLQNTASGQFKRHMAAIFSSMEKDKRTDLISGLEQFVQVGLSHQSAAIPRTTGAPRAAHSS